MAYATYTTDALVCGTYDRNTADRSYRLFTRELGMLWADARSVRLEKSKQRMALADFSLVRVSLVRGKSGWKIGSVTSQTNYYHIAGDQATRGSVVAVMRLLRRYVQGEEKQVELFDFVNDALLVGVGVVSERIWFDQCVAVRLLTLLGYVSVTKLPPAIQDSNAETFADSYSSENQALVADLLQVAESASQL